VKKIGLLVLPLMLVVIMGVFVGCKKNNNDNQSKQEFAYDMVLVRLTQEVVDSGKVYTIEYFPEINLSKVEYVSYDTFVDYSRLNLYLLEPSKENVLDAVQLLKQRSDILYASPNYYDYPTN